MNTGNPRPDNQRSSVVAALAVLAVYLLLLTYIAAEADQHMCSSDLYEGPQQRFDIDINRNIYMVLMRDLRNTPRRHHLR